MTTSSSRRWRLFGMRRDMPVRRDGRGRPGKAAALAPRDGLEQVDAWDRARMLPAWSACRDLLEQAIAADLDQGALAKFGERARDLALTLGNREPSLLQGWGSRLPIIVAFMVATDLEVRRHKQDLAGELLERFVNVPELDWRQTA